MTVESDDAVLISGGGIAGLSLALALARRGIRSRILERRPVLAEAGAGIQLGPNATRLLGELGVLTHLEPLAGRPEAIRVHEGASGRELAELPLGAWIAERHGGPYLVAHRADLQAALLAAVKPEPLVELVTGFEVSGFRDLKKDVAATATDGRAIAGPVLIGADGLWSTLRHRLFPGIAPTYAGKLAARTVIRADDADEHFSDPVTGIWLGPDAHIVHYPVRAGREIAVVVIVDEKKQRDGWGSDIEASTVLGRVSHFAPALIRFLEAGREWKAWSLYDPPRMPSWWRDRVALIGDAAHPMLPFLAQGGVMAIEDAVILAECYAGPRAAEAPAAVFSRYEEARRQRVTRVQEASKANGRIYHMAGLMALARNAVIAKAPSSTLMSRYDWLYGWRPAA